MKLIEVEPIFLKIRGGWLNPAAIMHTQTHPQNPAMLMVGVTGLERPIVLNETDSAYVSEYMESRTWPRAQQETQAVVADERLPIDTDDGS